MASGIWQHDIYNSGNWHDIPTICSECGHKYTEYVCGYEWEETGDLPNFCPHCGAKMRAETAEELKIRREQFKVEETSYEKLDVGDTFKLFKRGDERVYRKEREGAIEIRDSSGNRCEKLRHMIYLYIGCPVYKEE